MNLAGTSIDPHLVNDLAALLDIVERTETGDRDAINPAWNDFLARAVHGTDEPGLFGLVLCARLLHQMRPADRDLPLAEIAEPVASACTAGLAADETFHTHARHVIMTALADGEPSAGYAAELDAGNAGRLILVSLCVVAGLCAIQQLADVATDSPDATRGDPLRRCILAPGAHLAGVYTIGASTPSPQ